MTLQQAAQQSPTLARLTQRALDSQARLKAIESLIPSALLSRVKAGPADDKDWCLILDSSAAAAKMRQLLPALQAQLRIKGWEVNAIRLKVQISRNG